MSRIKFLTAVLAASLVSALSCSADNGNEQAAFEPSGNTRTLIAYFSAEGHTKAVAEAIQSETGADIFFIEPAVPYAENPYDDSEKIQNEAYNDLRPEVKNLLTDEQMAAYDVIFVGTPCWWHQPAMVVCTFLEHYDLSGKTVIPFVTYGATTYLNETMQKLYKCTPDSRHIPAELPEDIDPDNIREPQNDDAGIVMPTPSTVKQWLESIGYENGEAAVADIAYDAAAADSTVYSLSGMRLAAVPDSGFYISGGRKYIAR